MPVTIEVEVSVLVLRRPLARRSRVELADVEPQVRRMPGQASVFISDVATLQGHRLKRSLPVGTALTVDMLQPDLLVRRGQQVTLIAANGGVQIRAQGQALTEGAADERGAGPECELAQGCRRCGGKRWSCQGRVMKSRRKRRRFSDIRVFPASPNGATFVGSCRVCRKSQKLRVDTSFASVESLCRSGVEPDRFDLLSRRVFAAWVIPLRYL